MSFGAIQALKQLNFHILPGEIVGLMGDNGAGKSTLLKIISGYFQPTSGEVFVRGKRVQLSTPRELKRFGIESVYQDLALCDNLTAAENIFLGREITKNVVGMRLLDREKMNLVAGDLFMQLQSDTVPQQKVKRMSGGQRQAVAIARAIQSQAQLVLLDEPTAAISVRQVAQVLSLIERLKAQGVAVILISHRMPDIFSVCERVVVLRRGEKVADLGTVETNPEEITALITGAKERS